MTSTRRATGPTAPGPRLRTGRRYRSRSCTATTSRFRRRACSTATAPTRSRSTLPSRTIEFRCSTAAWSSPSHTCGAAARWAEVGTRTGGWSTRPTRSPTSSRAHATSSTPVSRGPGHWLGVEGRPAACSSAPSPTRHRSCTARWWPRSPSSTASRPCSTTSSRSPSASGRSGATQPPTRRPTGACSRTRPTTTSPAQNPDGSSRVYPDLFVTAGLNDPRVAYWEPAKWVAKLRSRSPTSPRAAAHRAGRGARRAVGSLRRLEGRGPGLRLPPRCAGALGAARRSPGGRALARHASIRSSRSSSRSNSSSPTTPLRPRRRVSRSAA